LLQLAQINKRKTKNIFCYILKVDFFARMTRPRKEVKKVEEVEGDQTKEENEEESEDHLWCSHDHIHCDFLLFVD